AVDRPAPGGGWLVGRHPASLGVLAHGSRSARVPARPPGDEEGTRRSGHLHGDRRRTAADGGVSVSGLRHRSRRPGPDRRLPSGDFGEVIDPPDADVTAHALEMLAGEGLAEDPRVVAGGRWLLAQQEIEGCWFGRWGANHVYGIGACLPALVATGMPAD